MSSVLNYMFDNDWIQRADIDNLQASAAAMRSRFARESGRVGDLEDQVAQLTLLNEALLRILEKKGVFARDEFRALLVEVDLEDGVHDGKLSRPAPKSAGQGARQAVCRFCRSANDPANKFCAHCRRPLVRA